MNEFVKTDPITGKKGINELNKKYLNKIELDDIFNLEYNIMDDDEYTDEAFNEDSIDDLSCIGDF